MLAFSTCTAPMQCFSFYTNHHHIEFAPRTEHEILGDFSTTSLGWYFSIFPHILWGTEKEIQNQGASVHPSSLWYHTCPNLTSGKVWACRFAEIMRAHGNVLMCIISCFCFQIRAASILPLASHICLPYMPPVCPKPAQEPEAASCV